MNSKTKKTILIIKVRLFKILAKNDFKKSRILMLIEWISGISIRGLKKNNQFKYINYFKHKQTFKKMISSAKTDLNDKQSMLKKHLSLDDLGVSVWRIWNTSLQFYRFIFSFTLRTNHRQIFSTAIDLHGSMPQAWNYNWMFKMYTFHWFQYLELLKTVQQDYRTPKYLCSIISKNARKDL